jgi:hypothetical protein
MSDKSTYKRNPVPTLAPQFLTKRQAADTLQTSVFFVEELLRSGQLKASRFSYRVLRIPLAEIYALAERTSCGLNEMPKAALQPSKNWGGPRKGAGRPRKLAA